MLEGFKLRSVNVIQGSQQLYLDERPHTTCSWLEEMEPASTRQPSLPPQPLLLAAERPVGERRLRSPTNPQVSQLYTDITIYYLLTN